MSDARSNSCFAAGTSSHMSCMMGALSCAALRKMQSCPQHYGDRPCRSVRQPIPLPCPLPVRPAPGTGRPHSAGSLQTCHLLLIPAHTRGPSRPLQELRRFPMMHACMMLMFSPARSGCGVHERRGPCCLSEGAAECTCSATARVVGGSDHACMHVDGRPLPL
jgi:hypothetical protein